ncbi:hypothetical protein U9M48_029486 [Paspalum notatum var. saurae]|uniref:Ionotropic glutamate receptor C-terminal domain-containing protein n=1 Tax=Paspalum notatum var. saurae TaxID=547442 RepID=A0AAQ3X177_PASNO
MISYQLLAPAGPELLSSILETDFDGLAGTFTLVDRHLQVPIYEFLINIFSFANTLADQIIKRLPSKVLVRLQPSVTDPTQLLRNGDYVGYQNGSFVLEKLKQLKFDERKIKVFSTLEEYAKALRAGSNHGGVSAIFDEIPYLNAFLVQYGREFQIVGHADSTDGFGFVFPRGSPLVPDLSSAILSLRGEQEGFAIHQKWFGDAYPSLDSGDPDTDSARLSLRSFAGLFIINGLVLAIVLLTSLFKTFFDCQSLYKFTWAWRRNHGLPRSHGNAGTVVDMEPQPSQNGTVLNDESLHIEAVDGNGRQQQQNGLATDSAPAEELQVETRTS